ncbi:RNA helicase Mov10l1 [Scleropages formosus]|uniref:RNA helicase Mov10l1 n=1 Tax=Scleropages formosus TaxID=113540 RepID=UPI000878A939|nr:RNA helicase Mov10l1 [Scleropages formosus]
MIHAMHGIIAKLLSPLWRTAEDEADAQSYVPAEKEIRHVSGGVVTCLCQDYGLIDDAVCFTSEEVLGGYPLHVGDAVRAIAVRGGSHDGWRAIRVERMTATWDDDVKGPKPESSGPKPLVGTITSCGQDGGFINQTTFFSRQALCQGFVPMKGDWVQAQYFINPRNWSSQASSVSPLRYRRMDHVRVSSMCGSRGTVEDSVFFTLDSLLLPDQYRPQPGDLVSVVVLESCQSLYSWRALCMAPTQLSLNPVPDLIDMDLQALLENKGGLVVSYEAQCRALSLGDTCELLVWIENQSSETQRLQRCQLAGWDAEGQFTLGTFACTVPPPQAQVLQPAAIARLLYKGLHSPRNNSVTHTHLPSMMGFRGVSLLPALSENGISEADVVDGAAPDKETSVRVHHREVEISPGEKVSVTVGCRARNLGRCTELLLLHFPKFTIGRCLEVAVRSEEEGLLQANAPYSVAAPLSKRQETRVVTVLPGPSPARLSKRHLPNFLANYPVPKALRDSVEAQRDVLLAQPQLTEPLSLSSMRPRFSALLWLEELEDEKELQELRLSCVFLRKGATYLHLEVPGLAEGRPRLIIGDRVLLKKPQSGGIVVEYVGYVTEVYEEDVSLRVNSEFHSCYMGEPLDVEFTLNRLTMRRCHCALEQIRHFGENALFPTTLVLQAPQWSGKWGPDDGAGVDNMPDDSREEGTNGSGKDADILSLCVNMVSVATQTKTDESTRCKGVPAPGRFFNSLLNPAQREAVKRILAGECRPTPYILFGPPGTGKTITLVEAILQVYHRLPGSRVLVCTPSNSAADLICERLHDSGFLNAASLVRVNATCRPEESIPEVVRQYSQAGEDIRQALFHRIVVSTCSSAGMFYQIRICVGHFTHVFIDEAGQATEPEALIPLGLLSEKDGQIVLAGDPLQLGPVVKSRLAATYGLGMSLLERLMSRTLYSRGEQGYNPLLVTKLVYNYRSHEALLALPSRLFYAGELCVRAERAVVDCLCNWNRLPTKGFPVIFHGIRGVEMREGSSPSWFNPGEAVQVMLYCCQLAKRLYKPIAATDIGVITPYRKQVEKIRLLLHRVGLMDIRVGSVEEFQGQEALVVILSTVRSNEVAVNEDSQFVLGFLSNHRRFNVAVTRPKALLIVVGNPHVLVKDPCFSALLQYCYENGAFLGCDLPSSIRAARRVLLDEENLK